MKNLHIVWKALWKQRCRKYANPSISHHLPHIKSLDTSNIWVYIFKHLWSLLPAFRQSPESSVPAGSWMSPAGIGGMFAGWGKWRRRECVHAGCSGCCCGRWRSGWTACSSPARYCPLETPDGSGLRLQGDVSHGHLPNLQKSITLFGYSVQVIMGSVQV